MIRSLETLDSAELSDATVCIVGAGAAGIALACELDGSPFKVLLLEAGGARLDLRASNEIYGGFAQAPHPNPAEFRRIVFGGTTGTWGGRCVPYDPIDFEKRDWIAESGWPISYADVAAYYPRAMSYCDAGAFDFSVAGSLGKGAAPTLPGFEDNGIILADRVERYSLPTHFGSRYRDRIASSANVIALLHARCVAVNRERGGERVESLSVLDRSGRSRTLRSRAFVLAVGGIETVRLLMNSDPEGPGLGNRSGALGRFYGCHLDNTLGRLIVNRGEPVFDFEKTSDGVYCRRKLQFSGEVQRAHRLLSSAFRLHFPSYSDAAHGSAALSTIYLAKSALIREHRAILQHGSEPAVRSSSFEHLMNIVRDLPSLGSFAYQWAFLRHFARRKLPYTLIKNRDGTYPVEFNCEQTPLASNRIALTDEVDPGGLRRVKVEWRLCEDDVQAMHRALLLLRDELGRHSWCRIEFTEPDLPAALGRSTPIGGHHLGAARMASAPREGVVDRDCALFELPNLFVASAAVFRTNSHANPTLTIVAFALRLAEHLKRVLGNAPAASSARAGPAQDARA